MEVRFTATRPRRFQASSRRWRSVLAGLISLALVLSFFHGWTFDGDEAAPVLSIAQTIDDFSGNAPAHPAPLHGDHCLTHVSSVTAQDTAVAIEYVAHNYRFVGMRSSEAADQLSPFEPPRA
jgi:hypothetical protein